MNLDLNEHELDTSRTRLDGVSENLYFVVHFSVGYENRMRTANWTRVIESEFIAAVNDATKNPRFVASGGKNLRGAGWQCVLTVMSPKEPTISTTAQLTSKWKRMKTDYIDYHFLIGLSGYGAGFENAKWDELDEGRKRKSVPDI